MPRLFEGEKSFLIRESSMFLLWLSLSQPVARDHLGETSDFRKGAKCPAWSCTNFSSYGNRLLPWPGRARDRKWHLQALLHNCVKVRDLCIIVRTPVAGAKIHFLSINMHGWAVPCYSHYTGSRQEEIKKQVDFKRNCDFVFWKNGVIFQPISRFLGV